MEHHRGFDIDGATLVDWRPAFRANPAGIQKFFALELLSPLLVQFLEFELSPSMFLAYAADLHGTMARVTFFCSYEDRISVTTLVSRK